MVFSLITIHTIFQWTVRDAPLEHVTDVPGLGVHGSVHMAMDHPTSKTILIVDTRGSEAMLPTIRSVIRNTSPEWSLTLIHPLHDHEDGHNGLKRMMISSGRDLVIRRFDFQIGEVGDYSATMMKPEIWKLVEAEHLLLIQGDSVMCNDGLDEFLEYDYVGAPWNHKPDNISVGNGGFSLRSRRLMEWCASNYTKHRNDPEDLFFSHCALEHGRVPSSDIAVYFSMESVWTPAPMGVHKLWWSMIMASSNKTKEEVEALLCAHCPAIADVPGTGVVCGTIQ